MTTTSFITSLLSWLFGCAVFVIGLVNTFWGNDPGFGIFIVLLAFIYFPPVSLLIREKTGFTIPVFMKIALGLFIVWAALGVGELFDKVELMMRHL